MRGIALVAAVNTLLIGLALWASGRTTWSADLTVSWRQGVR